MSNAFIVSQFVVSVNGPLRLNCMVLPKKEQYKEWVIGHISVRPHSDKHYSLLKVMKNEMTDKEWDISYNWSLSWAKDTWE
jgi:hypothetical protein